MHRPPDQRIRREYGQGDSQQLHRVRFDEDLARDGEAEATLQTWDGEDWADAGMATNTVTVHDAFGDTRARENDKGYAIYSPTAQRFELLRSPRAEKVIRFRNDSGETIPAYAVMRVTGADSEGDGTGEYLTTTKPDDTFSRWYAVNSGSEVEADDFGECQIFGKPCLALYDFDSSPANGQEWGPVPGEWFLGENTVGGFYSTGAVDIIDEAPVMVVIGLGIDQVIGTPEVTHTAGTSVAYLLYTGPPLLETATSYITEDVANRTSQTIAVGKWATITFINGQPYAELWQC